MENDSTASVPDYSLTFPSDLAVISVWLIAIRVQTIQRIRWERGIGFNFLLNSFELVRDLLRKLGCIGISKGFLCLIGVSLERACAPICRSS